jgi:signal transduction histidine kinase
MAIRTKLTIYYISVLALVLIAFGAGVYAVLTFSLVRQLETNLQQAADSAAVVINTRSTFRVENPDGGVARVLLPAVDPFRDTEVLVEFLAKNGKVVAVSSELYGDKGAVTAPLDATTIERLVKTEQTPVGDVFGTVRVAGGSAFYVLTRPVRDPSDNALLGYIQVATSMATIERAQSVLFLSLVALGSAGLLIAGVLGAFIARRALRPVDRVTQTALAIYRAENLDQRVPEIRTEDEIGRLSAAFNEMLDRLSRVFSAQQRLVADVSHEMRTPLTVIRGNVDLLNTMGCADQESLDALKRESDRMTRMVGDLLLLSQADTGQLSMQVQPTDLDFLISDVERAGRMLAAERVRVSAEYSGNITVMADADRLKQVLLNLTDNAIKHTPDGGSVRIEAHTIFNGFARITVTDTGVGIPEADLPHVFERFYRVDKSRSRERGGSGLGLSIAQKIIEAHKGRITVTSQVGAGTTFDVYVPITDAAYADDLAEPSSASHGRKTPVTA